MEKWLSSRRGSHPTCNSNGATEYWGCRSKGTAPAGRSTWRKRNVPVLRTPYRRRCKLKFLFMRVATPYRCEVGAPGSKRGRNTALGRESRLATGVSKKSKANSSGEWEHDSSPLVKARHLGGKIPPPQGKSRDE